MKEYIYIAYSRHDFAVRYVGLSNNPLRRFKEHISNRAHSLAVKSWVAWVERIGSEVAIQEIDEAETHEGGLEKESFWIQYFANRGAQLLNSQHASITRKRTEEIFEEMAERLRSDQVEELFNGLVDKIVSGHFEEIPVKSLAIIEWRLSIYADNTARDYAVFSHFRSEEPINWREKRTIRAKRLGIRSWEEYVRDMNV